MTARPDIAGLASAAQRALAAEAVILREHTDAGCELLAAEGLRPGDLKPVLHALGALDVEDPGVVVDVRGYRGMLQAEAIVDEGRRLLLTALRRDRGGFENARSLDAFARQAALALRRHGGARPDGAEELIRSTLAAADLGDLVHRLAAQLERRLGCTRAGLFLWDERAGLLQLAPGSFYAELEMSASIPGAVVDWASCTARVFATGHPYLANDAPSDSGILPDYAAHFGLRQLLSVPFDTPSRRIGVLQLADKPGGFDFEDVAAAAKLADALADGVQAARARFALARRGRLEEIIGSAAVDIATGKHLQDFLGPVLDDMGDALTAVSLALIPVDGDPVIWRRGDVNTALERILLADAQNLWTLRAHVASPRRAGGSGWASLHVPIVVHGQRVGALAALRQRGEPFGRDERRAVSRLAHLIALAWTTEHYQRLRADEARVAERRRIGEDLHDNASQLLFAARVSVEALRESPVLPGDLASQLERTHELIARADAAVREVINAPEPAKPAGLGERLGEIVSAVEDEFRRPVQLVVSAPAAEAARTLSAHAHNLLGKVVREALVNAAKHAGPCQIAVSVSLTRRRRLLLSVSDDGIGTPSGRHADGFGLTATRRAVRRQGGVLRVHCGATGGTRVAVSLPL